MEDRDLRLEDFDSFFSAVNHGSTPFAWQRRLVKHVTDHGKWPEAITAPTGAGKSSVVDIHVFCVALSAIGAAPRLPRRLSVVVNRRALVDSHLMRARAIGQALAMPDTPVLRGVARALWSMHGRPSGAPLHDESPLVSVNLRGGVTVGREWLDDPRACAVIAATPDMWGSRLLFRGYGTSMRGRPHETGLVSLDSIMVLDEAHLNRQLLFTAERAAAQIAREANAVGVPGLQVCAVSATPTSRRMGVSVGVEPEDLTADSDLARRLTRPKPVTIHASSRMTQTHRKSDAYVNELAAVARRLKESVSTVDGVATSTVGIVVNHVDTAIRVAQRLRQATSGEVLAWIGRMRPLDLTRQRSEHPGAFTVEGDSQVDFLVTTQTVEVGVDLDLAGLVTELASGSALAQRAGRVNRLGERAVGPVVVMVPESGATRDVPPYTRHELESAYAWVHDLADTDDGMAPWPLASVPNRQPPQAGLDRVLTTLQYHHVDLLAHTSTLLFAEPDLAFHLRDSLEADQPAVNVVVRDPLPADDSAAMSLLQVTPPDAVEMFPASMSVVKSVLQTALAGRSRSSRAFRWRDDELTQLNSVDEGDLARPGDVFVIDPHPVVIEGVVVESNGDWAEGTPTEWGDPERKTEVILAGSGEDQTLRALADSDEDARTDFASDRLGLPRVELLLGPSAGSLPAWAVVRGVARSSDNMDVRQHWTPADHPITLDVHAAAVEARATAMARGVGVEEVIVDSLAAAGRWHDAGKADPRFQQVLAAPPDALWAKSCRSVPQWSRRRYARMQPAGWRHEQMSAVLVAAETDVPGDRSLVTRLVGTSHGCGRPFFPHGATRLLGAVPSDPRVVETASRLFESGSGWSDLIEETHAAYGLWGCAYLEAIVRSADCQVSKEGS